MTELAPPYTTRRLLLALAERVDQVLWCLRIATDPTCNVKTRTRAALEAYDFATEAEGLLLGNDDPPQRRDPQIRELLEAVDLTVQNMSRRVVHNRRQFIAAVHARVPDITEDEILAAVRYGGAREARAVQQSYRIIGAEGRPLARIRILKAL